ncbi:MAG: hypothetical protein Q8R28_04545, partial [Dehalococcoidia bacterium]|nr:hypothetical protein [Dehalococcoidia bacterium]
MPKNPKTRALENRIARLEQEGSLLRKALHLFANEGQHDYMTGFQPDPHSETASLYLYQCTEPFGGLVVLITHGHDGNRPIKWVTAHYLEDLLEDFAMLPTSLAAAVLRLRDFR